MAWRIQVSFFVPESSLTHNSIGNGDDLTPLRFKLFYPVPVGIQRTGVRSLNSLPGLPTTGLKLLKPAGKLCVGLAQC